MKTKKEGLSPKNGRVLQVLENRALHPSNDCKFEVLNNQKYPENE